MSTGNSLYRLVQLAALAGIAGLAAAAWPATADSWHHHWHNAGGWRGRDRASLSLDLAPGYAPYPYDTPPPAFVVPPRVYHPPAPPTPFYAPAPYPRPSLGLSAHIN